MQKVRMERSLMGLEIERVMAGVNHQFDKVENCPGDGAFFTFMKNYRDQVAV